MIYLAVVSFALGIVSENVFGLGWSFAVFIILVSSTVSLVLRFQHLRKTAVCVLFFSLGLLRMTTADFLPDPNLFSPTGEKISFEAIISEEPDLRDVSIRYTVTPCGQIEEKNSAKFYVCDQKRLLSKNKVLLIAARFPEFQYGDKVRVSGVLEWPKNFISKSGTEFDYISYLSKDGVHFLVYHPQIDKLNDGEEYRAVSYLYRLKDLFIKKIEQVVPEPNSSLLGGIIFGVKQSLGQEILDDFRKVGLIHIVVLSGYNITVIAAGIFYATSFTGERKFGFATSVASIILFAIMVGFGATVVRASIMALIAVLARFLGRPADALRWLFIAGFLMVLYNPLTLVYDPSFQLSFTATLGLILFSPFVYSFISKYSWRKFLPEKFGVREIVSSTIAVQFFIMPLLIKMSGFASIVSFIINPLILPLIPWMMAFGALTGALGIVSQTLAFPSGTLSYFLTEIVIRVTKFSANIPYATFQAKQLPLWVVSIWYLFYGYLYVRLKKRS